MPPAGYEAMGIKTDAQWMALMIAINGVDTTIKLIVQMAPLLKEQ